MAQAYGSAFARVYNRLWAGFSTHVAYNTAFDLARVKSELLETGWQAVHFAQALALASPLDDPEGEGRVFIAARKPKAL